MGTVVSFDGVTRLDIDPERILESAKGRLSGVVIVGYTKDGDEEYFASSIADGADVLWLLERSKKALLEIVDGNA